MTAKARSGISSTPCGGPLRGGLHQMVVARGSCSAKQFTPRSVEVAAFASLRKNFLRVATAMQECSMEGMQHGSLIRWDEKEYSIGYTRNIRREIRLRVFVRKPALASRRRSERPRLAKAGQWMLTSRVHPRNARE